jgi:tRNA pseudouridine13 synthase
MMLAGSRSHFTAEKGVSMLPERLASLDIHVSGPLWGDLKAVQGQPAWQRECSWLEGEAELRDSVARTGANPARRALRATFDDLALKWTHDSNPRLVFTLGRGCYATSLLRELVLFDLP